jgi:tetratricopeptide (TPR) repeat protein
VVDDRTAASSLRELAARPVDSLRAELMRQRLHARMFGESSPPPRIARFRVIEPIGSGGMGTVYLAWDETLARSIALKFLHQREGDELVAEAQALARLAHPNVVAVFDVGVHEGRVWLAMEYVPGRTLRAWQRHFTRHPKGRERPGRAELLATWIAAGRGLAVVHAAGLIHRDIKPDNVLLGDDGRVRLIDFGLVLAQSSSTATSGRSGSGSDSTERQGFAGTSGYASPEQRDGSVIDARADQYAFCVSVWEAFAGRRPVRDEAGIVRAPDLAGVPRRVSAALRRGLAVDPSERWPSMAALLDALEPRRRRLGWIAGLAAATTIGLVVGFLGATDPSPAIDRCASAGAALDPDLADTLAEGPLRSGVEQWILDWQAVAVRACRDHERAPLPALGQRSACLEYRRLEMIGLLDHLGRVRADEQALDTRRLELGDPRACLRGGDEALALPDEHAEAIGELRHALADLDQRTGDRAIAVIPEAERVLVEARAIAWPPLIGEAALVLARVHIHANDPERARELIGETLDLAQRHDQSELAARAWGSMVLLASEFELDPDAADWAWQRQRAVIERLGPGALDRGRLAAEQAQIAQLRGDPVGAERALGEAILEFEQAGLSGRLQLLGTLDRLAFVVGSAGRVDEVQVLSERRRALELELESSTRQPGPAAGEAERAFEAGQLALALGQHATAIAQLELALLGYRRANGSESPQVAQTHVALAQVFDAIGELDQAELHAERADSICLARLGPDHPLRTATLSALGTIALRRGDPAASVRSFRLALQIEQTRPGGGGADRALARSNLAEALIAAGDPSEARWQAELALTELAASVPANHSDLAYPHKALGWALLEIGDHAGARDHLARALALPSWSVVETREIEALLARAN